MESRTAALGCVKCLLSRSSNPSSVYVNRFFSSRKARKKKETHYEVLGISDRATLKEIRAAFVTRSKEVHPDHNPTDPLNKERFIEVNEAYSVLSKHASKREYDFHLDQSRIYTEHVNESSSTGSSKDYNFSPRPETARERYEKYYWDDGKIYYSNSKNDGDYYGIKGVKRLPNTYIVGGCFVLIGLGCILFLSAWQIGGRKRSAYFRAVELEAVEYKRMMKEQGKGLSPEMQNKLFQTKLLDDQAKFIQKLKEKGIHR